MPSFDRLDGNGLSVVIPAYNAEDCIARTLSGLRTALQPLCPRLEFIVVDDGSHDNTAEVVGGLQAATQDIRLLRNQRNLGKGFSVYIGLLAARNAKVCFTDADLPFTQGSYAGVVQPLLQGRPFVAASRRLPESELLVRMEVLGYAARRHFIGMVFNRMVRLLLQLPYRDTQCGLKGFDRDLGIELFRRVRSPRFLFDIELFVAARELGIAVHEVPVCVAYNDFKSSVRLSGDSARMFAGTLSIAQRWRRGEYRVADDAMDPALVATFAIASEPPMGAACTVD